MNVKLAFVRAMAGQIFDIGVRLLVFGMMMGTTYAFGPCSECKYHCLSCYDTSMCWIPRANGVQPPGSCRCSGYPKDEAACKELLCAKKPSTCCGCSAGIDGNATVVPVVTVPRAPPASPMPGT